MRFAEMIAEANKAGTWEGIGELPLGVIEAIEDAEDIIADLLAALKHVEWAPDLQHEPRRMTANRCPWCRHSQREGHWEKCQLSAAIAAAKPEEVERG